MDNLVRPDAVLATVKATSKKQALQEIAGRAEDVYGIEARLVVEKLLAREKLGSTSMGGGVAIPHARIPGVDRIVGLFARIEKPVDFDAADGQGVDLMFVLLAPESAGADHLRALAKVSRLLRDKAQCAKLRATAEREALFALLTDIATSRAA